MRHGWFWIVCFFFVNSFPSGSRVATARPSMLQAGQSQTPASASHPVKAPGFRLEDSTPVKLGLLRSISSAEAKVNDLVDFQVLEEVKVNDVVVIPKGSVAWGTVGEAQPKRRRARGGKLKVNVDSVRLADGEKAPLRAVRDAKGETRTGAMTTGLVLTGIGFFPAAPLFLLMHGHDVTVPQGTQFTAYIHGDVNLDPVKFRVKTVTETPPPPPVPAPAAAAPPVASPPPAAATPPPSAPVSQLAPQTSVISGGPELSTVVVISNPNGAEITVDGKYLGNTPSTLRLAPGDHTISVGKAGFKTWQRTMTVTAGGVATIDVTLEKNR